MSFNYEGVGKNIAVVKNKNNENSRSEFRGGNAPDKVNDKNVYMSGEEEAKNSYSTLETKANEFFQLVKDPEQESNMFIYCWSKWKRKILLDYPICKTI